jgi:ribosomal-protein-serine acetyltransferase
VRSIRASGHHGGVSPLPDRLETERLVLRTWRPEDAEALGIAITESLDHLLPWMPWAALEPLPLEDRIKLIRGWHDEWQAGKDVVFGVFRDGAVIGGSGLHQRIGPTGLEIGYWIHVGHVRRGYAAEASAALTDLAFTLDGIERVEIHHDRANVASSSVPRSIGYELVGEKPDTRDAPGEEGVDCTWAMTRGRWIERA